MRIKFLSIHPQNTLLIKKIVYLLLFLALLLVSANLLQIFLAAHATQRIIIGAFITTLIILYLLLRNIWNADRSSKPPDGLMPAATGQRDTRHGAIKYKRQKNLAVPQFAMC